MAALLLLFLGVTPAGAAVLVQCPTDTDGNGTSDDPNVLCIHLSSGDGFVKMADGYGQYIFSFNRIPGTIPSTNTAYPAEDVVSNFVGRAMSPAPTIKPIGGELRQGMEIYLSLTNVGMIMRPDLFDSHSVHWHGFPNAGSVFDGVPEVSPAAAMQATQPYYYKALKEGTFFYHCHVEASEHMQMGMIGNLYVLPSQDGTSFEYPAGSGRNFSKFIYNDGDGSTGHNVAFPIQLTTFDSNFHDASIDVQPLPFAMMKDNYFMINGRGYPDTVNPNPDDMLNNAAEMSGGYIENYVAQTMDARITANVGNKIALRLSNVSTTDLITVATTLGVPMRVVGRGAELLRGPDPDGAGPLTGKDTSYLVNTLNIGGGQAFDVIIDTTGVQPGTYFFYTTNLQFLSNNAEERGGIMTEIVIN